MPADAETHEAINEAVDRVAKRIDSRLDAFAREASDSRTRLHGRLDSFGLEFRSTLSAMSTQVASLASKFESHERYDEREHARLDSVLDTFAEKLEAAEREGSRERHGWARAGLAFLGGGAGLELLRRMFGRDA